MKQCEKESRDYLRGKKVRADVSLQAPISAQSRDELLEHAACWVSPRNQSRGNTANGKKAGEC